METTKTITLNVEHQPRAIVTLIDDPTTPGYGGIDQFGRTWYLRQEPLDQHDAWLCLTDGSRGYDIVEEN